MYLTLPLTKRNMIHQCNNLSTLRLITTWRTVHRGKLLRMATACALAIAEHAANEEPTPAGRMNLNCGANRSTVSIYVAHVVVDRQNPKAHMKGSVFLKACHS